MSETKLKLFVDSQFMSPYVMSAFVVLREKGLDFEMETVDLKARQNLQPEYRALSLTGRVPSLAHGELMLSESSAITEYLEDVFAPPTYSAVYPHGAVERARARQVQAWLRSDLAALREERPTTVIFAGAKQEPLSAEAQVAVQKLFQVAETLLQGRNTLFNQWSIADTDLALMLNRLVAHDDDVPKHLADYVSGQWQRPSVQAWLELGQKS